MLARKLASDLCSVALLEVANTARPRNQAHDEYPSENLQAPVRSRQGLSKAMSSKLSKATTLALLTGGGTSAAALAWFLLSQTTQTSTQILLPVTKGSKPACSSSSRHKTCLGCCLSHSW